MKHSLFSKNAHCESLQTFSRRNAATIPYNILFFLSMCTFYDKLKKHNGNNVNMKNDKCGWTYQLTTSYDMKHKIENYKTVTSQVM